MTDIKDALAAAKCAAAFLYVRRLRTCIYRARGCRRPSPPSTLSAGRADPAGWWCSRDGGPRLLLQTPAVI